MSEYSKGIGPVEGAWLQPCGVGVASSAGLSPGPATGGAGNGRHGSS